VINIFSYSIQTIQKFYSFSVFLDNNYYLFIEIILRRDEITGGHIGSRPITFVFQGIILYVIIRPRLGLKLSNILSLKLNESKHF
jgi:hypothetical protein